MKCVVIAALVAIAAYPPSSSAAPVCVFGTIPCFVLCGSPPRITATDQAVLWLRENRYETLTWVDKSTALFTTQLGKCMGINGWKRYKVQVSAVGTVYQAATSWDGLQTVDLVLENLNGHTFHQLIPQLHYIRAEVIGRVWKHLDHPPRRGDMIRVQGELHWDGHGFLEIHPSQVSDVQFLLTPFKSSISQEDGAFLHWL